MELAIENTDKKTKKRKVSYRFRGIQSNESVQILEDDDHSEKEIETDLQDCPREEMTVQQKMDDILEKFPIATWPLRLW